MADNMNDLLFSELKEHRKIFDKLYGLIGQQDVSVAKLTSAVENLATNISKFDSLTERLTILEQWRDAHRLEERTKELEAWKLKVETTIAVARAKLTIIIAVFLTVSSLVGYTADKIITKFF